MGKRRTTVESEEEDGSFCVSACDPEIQMLPKCIKLYILYYTTVWCSTN